MSEPIRALLVEDKPGDARLLREALAEVDSAQFELVHVRRLSDALRRLEKEYFSVILLDLSLPDAQGLDTIVRTRKRGAPIVVLTDVDDKTLAVNALREGAQDYLVKGQIDGPLLELSIRYAIERYRAEEMVQQHAYYDSSTGLPNRNLLRDRLQQAILGIQGENKSVALLMMDLDRFKEVNDILGHQFGDLLLYEIGPRLKGTLRESDMVARTNLKSLEQCFVIGRVKLDVGGCMGIALFPEHGTDPDILIKRAYVAMYAAKETRSGYAIYSAGRDQRNSASLMLMGELRRAIVENQLFLQYQPKIDLQTGRVSGVEALVRWQHPQYGIMVPDQFIPLAEQTGLIMPLTLWVLHEALRQCRALHQAGLDISMAVNLSRHNLQAQELPEQIVGILKSCGVPPADLELEITESAIMANPGRAMEVLGRMKNIGLRFSLDDFGTGYSSLAYLKKLPVNEIKIDKSFVINMRANEQDVAIVRLIIDLGHILRLKVVAEGVENQETMDQLVALGCDMAQGYYISRPIPADKLAGRLLSHPPSLCYNKSQVET